MAVFESKLKKLTLDQKKEAFSKAKAEADFHEGYLVLITAEYYPKALEYMRTQFIHHEPIEKALGLEWNDEVEAFWLSFFKWDISIMLLAENGDIMAIRTNCFLSYDEQADPDAFKTHALKLTVQFCAIGGAKADFFGHFGAKECIHFFGLGTNERYRHNHIATRMMKTAVAMAKYLGVEYIKGEGSNNYTKRIYMHQGFELLHEELYDDFVVDGEKPIRNTGENKSIRFYGLKI